MKDTLNNFETFYHRFLKQMQRTYFNLEAMADIKDVYASIVDNYVLLNETFGFQNPLEYYTLYYQMVSKGYFSSYKTFNPQNEENFYNLKKYLSLDIINGSGNCKHIASLFQSILSAAEFDNGLLILNVSKLKYEIYLLKNKLRKLYQDLEKSNNNRIKEYIKNTELKIAELENISLANGDNDITGRQLIPNHIINICVYQGKVYFLDGTLKTYYRYNGQNLETVYDDKIPAIFESKAYQMFENNMYREDLEEVVLLPTISEEEQRHIITSTENILEDNQDLLEKFYQENRENYNFITRKLVKYPK